MAKRAVAQESKQPEPEYNHFDEFCRFVRGQWQLSDEFQTNLIKRFMAGQRDAYERGEEHQKSLRERR
jgi:hypothetical protein